MGIEDEMDMLFIFMVEILANVAFLDLGMPL